MNSEDILSKVDHTQLAPAATSADIRGLCDDAIRFSTASVCIPPSYVREARAYVGDRMKVCTVIGFPNGYNTTSVKAFEAADAVRNGADEIDMVINIGWVKDGRFDELTSEIMTVREACEGRTLKVIIETCLLTDDEKIKMCECVTKAGADYIKTSTGFSTGGATPEDIALFKAHVGQDVKIKAAGGIRNFDDAVKMIENGADRLGTSRLVKLMKEVTHA